LKASFLAAALLSFCASALAQTIYSKVDPDGHATFSDIPSTAPETGPEDVSPKTPAGIVRKGSRRGSSIDASEAERRLAQARLKRQHGMRPLPGELASGSGSGLNYRYWRRQERLRLEVERAQQRVNATGPAQMVRR
jgi:hypothetical protein